MTVIVTDPAQDVPVDTKPVDPAPVVDPLPPDPSPPVKVPAPATQTKLTVGLANANSVPLAKGDQATYIRRAGAAPEPIQLLGDIRLGNGDLEGYDAQFHDDVYFARAQQIVDWAGKPDGITTTLPWGKTPKANAGKVG